MKMPSANGSNPTEPIAVLSVSPMGEDHSALELIFRQHSVSAGDQEPKLQLVTSWTLEKAIALLRIDSISIAICERDLRPGSWQDLLERTLSIPQSPLMIVTSRLADERMWGEALNLGAWDVLAKPFDHTEVIRVVETAWRRWKDQHEPLAGVHQKYRAAS